MTARTSCFKSIAVRPAFLKNSLRRSWVHTVWYSIALFIIMPIAHMMSQSSLVKRYGSYPPDYTTNVKEKMIQRFANNLEGFYYLTLLTLIGIGIMAGVATVRYLMSRRSAYFFHSLPVSRYELFSTNVISRLTSIFIAVAINLALCAVIYSAFGFISLYGEFFVLVLRALMYALLFFAITVFAGMLTGQTYACLAALAYILFILPALYGTIKTVIEYSYFFTVDFIPSSWFVYTSPVLRLIYSDIPLTAGGVILTVIATLAILAGAYFMYLLRRSEMSGTPVVFEKLAEIARCIFFFPLVFFTGVLFEAIAGELWRYIGYVIGACVGTMAANLMLYRNPKLMFRGWKKSVICFIAFLAVWFIFGTGVISFDRSLPDPNFVDEVVFSVGDEYEYDTDDKELIELALEMVHNNMELYDGRGNAVNSYEDSLKSNPTEYVNDSVYPSWAQYMQISFKTKLGFTNTKSFRFCDVDSVRGFLLAYIESGDYIETMYEKAYEAKEKHVDYGHISYGFGYQSNSLDVAEDDMRKVLSALAVDITDSDYMESPIVARIVVYVALDDGLGRQYMSFPLRAGDTRTISVIAERTGYAASLFSVEGILESLDETNDVAVDVECNGRTVTYTDRADIAAILNSCTQLTYDYGLRGIALAYSDFEYSVYLNWNVKSDIEGYYDYSLGTMFFAGKVPDFVTEDFGK